MPVYVNVIHMYFDAYTDEVAMPTRCDVMITKKGIVLECTRTNKDSINIQLHHSNVEHINEESLSKLERCVPLTISLLPARC